MLDIIFKTAFQAAHSAIFEVGAVMAVLMLVFGILDYKLGDRLRSVIVERKLDRPSLMLALALIPVDGTLLFQYTAYRRRAIRPGSLLSGMIGIGEESTYLVLTYQPLSWLLIAIIKAVTILIAGNGLNRLDQRVAFSDRWHKQDDSAAFDKDAIEADENFHELPDKFRHKLHHFRYHLMGRFFWIMFSSALAIQILLRLLSGIFDVPVESYEAMGIPLISWLAMIGIMIVLLYRLVTRLTTREFGKIFEHEFEDTGDAIGDLAEICAGVILMIFLISFVVGLVVEGVGIERIASIFSGRGVLTVVLAVLIGLIPGTGPSLAFTALYFSLAGTPGALPFASLLACSMALIGDSKFVGSKQIKHSQQRLHGISAIIALIVGLLALAAEPFAATLIARLFS